MEPNTIGRISKSKNTSNLALTNYLIGLKDNLLSKKGLKNSPEEVIKDLILGTIFIDIIFEKYQLNSILDNSPEYFFDDSSFVVNPFLNKKDIKKSIFSPETLESLNLQIGKNTYREIHTLLAHSIYREKWKRLDSLEFSQLFEALLSMDWSISRVKSGAFYTPEYLTRWMSEEFIPKSDSVPTICDPSVGSGNFLISALRVLKKRFPQESGAYVVSSLFGVDINPDAVKISKFSIWLELSKDREKLPNLDGNIKIGDSLLDFEWKKEFKSVFKNGGFDLILGNAPFVRHELLIDIKQELEIEFKVFDKKADLYVYFLELSKKLINKNGKTALITSNKWLKSEYGQNLRKWSLSSGIAELYDFGDLPVFGQVAAYPVISIFNNQIKKNVKYIKFNNLENFKNHFKTSGEILDIPMNSLNENPWVFKSTQDNSIEKKLNSKWSTIDQLYGKSIFRGFVSGLAKALVISLNFASSLKSKDRILKPCLSGRDIKAFENVKSKNAVIKIDDELQLSSNRLTHSYLTQFKKELKMRSKGNYDWYQLQSCPKDSLFKEKKIVYQVFQTRPAFAFDQSGAYFDNSVWAISNADEFLLAYLNSSLCWYFISQNCTEIRGGYQLIYKYFKNVPVPNKEMLPLAQVNAIVTLTKKILSGSRDREQLANEIDEMFFEILNLNSAEIRKVKSLMNQDRFITSRDVAV